MINEKKWHILVPEIEGFDQEKLSDEIIFILEKQFFSRDDWAGFAENFKDRKALKYKISVQVEWDENRNS